MSEKTIWFISLLITLVIIAVFVGMIWLFSAYRTAAYTMMFIAVYATFYHISSFVYHLLHKMNENIKKKYEE